MRSKRTLLAIVGPTASGKSYLAIHLAKQYDGEIINCDSLQLYRHFDIGTGKLTPAEQQGIPHHLIDVLNPDQRFAAGEYARLATCAIAQIESRGKLPIIAGGTGFYLRALVDGLFPEPGKNPALRERLRWIAARKGRPHLHRMLQRLDPQIALNIHQNDVPKVLRAIEVCLQARRPMSELFQLGKRALQGYIVVKVGLNPPRAELYEKINVRTRCMFESGMAKEVERILALGVPKTAPPFQSHGYREALAYLEGSMTLGEAIRIAQNKTRQYAKRQLTWFRKEPAVEWLPGFGTDAKIQEQAVALLTPLLL